MVLTGNSVERVDKRLLEIKPPGVIVESLEVFNITFKFWKGNIILLNIIIIDLLDYNYYKYYLFLLLLLFILRTNI